MPDDVDQEARQTTTDYPRRRRARRCFQVARVTRASLVTQGERQVAGGRRRSHRGARLPAERHGSQSRQSPLRRRMGIVTSNAHDVFYADVVDGFSSYINESERGLVPLILHGNHDARGRDGSPADASSSSGPSGSSSWDRPSPMPPSKASDERPRPPRSDDGSSRTPSTSSSTTTALGAAMATKHLLDLGHRRIAHITGGDGNGSRAREAQLSTHHGGGRLRTASWSKGTYLQPGGAAGARQLLDATGPLPTAIFAANDLAAIGAMDVLQRAGHRVPDDVSVIGYDDIHWAALAPIDLTTINQPAWQMGQTAARLLCDRRTQRQPRRARRVLLEPTLVVRSTTRAI